MISHNSILAGLMAAACLAVPVVGSKSQPPLIIYTSLESIAGDAAEHITIADLNYQEWLRRLRCDRFITQISIQQCAAAAARHNQYELTHRPVKAIRLAKAP